MTPVFLDIGLIALWNRRDQWHAAATAAFAALHAERAAFVSTSYVIAECANALSRFDSRAQLARLVEGLQESGGLIFPTANEWWQGWAGYVRGYAGSARLVDHLSFDVMHRLGLTRAFTNDHHFTDAGFEPLF